MKLFLLIFYLFSSNISYAFLIKDPSMKQSEKNKDVINELSPSYNPYSIYVPSKTFLSKLLPDKVMDMGASAYSINHLSKALYFYSNAIELFDNDIKTISWATYEKSYAYYKKRQYDTALTSFNQIQTIKGAPTTVQNLAKMMATRIENRKDFVILRKQEDLVFISERKARMKIDRQISKEERIADHAQRKMSKERRRREKEDERVGTQLEKRDK